MFENGKRRINFKWFVFAVSGLIAFLSGCISGKKGTVPTSPGSDPAATNTPTPVSLPEIPGIIRTCYAPMLIQPTPTVTVTATATVTVTETLIGIPIFSLSPLPSVGMMCYAPMLNTPMPNESRTIQLPVATPTPLAGAGIKGTNPVIAAELKLKGFLSAHAYARITGLNA